MPYSRAREGATTSSKSRLRPSTASGAPAAGLRLGDPDPSGRELAHSEAPYRKLLRVSTNLLWTTANNDGQKTTDQIEWQAFTGQTEAQSCGFKWLDAVHPDDREATMTAWRHAVATETTFQVRATPAPA